MCLTDLSPVIGHGSILQEEEGVAVFVKEREQEWSLCAGCSDLRVTAFPPCRGAERWGRGCYELRRLHIGTLTPRLTLPDSGEAGSKHTLSPLHGAGACFADCGTTGDAVQ